MCKIIKLNESYIKIFCDYDLSLKLYEYFSFYAENYIWSPEYNAGVWDGKIRLYNKKSGLLPIGLEDRLIIFFKTNNIKYQNKIKKIKGLNFSKEFIQKFNQKMLKCDLKLYDYQISAIQQILKHQKIIITSATGSGKSLILFLVINILKYLNDNFKFLLVVPTTSLTHQMLDDFIDYGKNFQNYNEHVHIIYSGKEKNTSKPITISTWQSLQNLKSNYFLQFDCVIVDETHGATAKELNKIVRNCINSIFKIGVTGSLKDNKTNRMQLISLFSRTYSASKTKQLQKRNILSKLKIRNCILEYSNDDRYLCKNLAYPDETNFIRSSKQRMKFIDMLIKKIHGNNLILFRNIEYGKKIYEMLKEKNFHTYLIYGITKVKDRELCRKFAEQNDNVIIVASFGTFSEGINIKKLHNLIFAESMKSNIKVIQSIGRALRLHKSKKYAILYDIVDNLQYKKRKNYILKHFLERIKLYNDQDFNYKTKTFNLEKI